MPGPLNAKKLSYKSFSITLFVASSRYLLLGTHQLPLSGFLGALQFLGERDMDVDEVQCILANLIDKVSWEVSVQYDYPSFQVGRSLFSTTTPHSKLGGLCSVRLPLIPLSIAVLILMLLSISQQKPESTITVHYC